MAPPPNKPNPITDIIGPATGNTLTNNSPPTVTNPPTIEVAIKAELELCSIFMCSTLIPSSLILLLIIFCLLMKCSFFFFYFSN